MFQKFIPTQIHYSPLKSQNLKILQPNQMQTKINQNLPKTSHMATVKIDRGYQTVSMFNVFLQI